MSENEILNCIRNDGQRELGLIYEKYRSEFLHWIGKEFHCSADDTKDIYQVAILIFYNNVKSGRLEHLVSSVKTYLFAIGKNVAREHLRSIKRDTAWQEKWLREPAVHENEGPGNEYAFEAANKALARLGEPGRTIVQLYYYDRKSMQEISAILNYKNPETAKNQKCKAMAILRKLFKEEFNKQPGFIDVASAATKAASPAPLAM